MESQNILIAFAVEGADISPEEMMRLAERMTYSQIDNLLRDLDPAKPNWINMMKTFVEIKHIKDHLLQ